jgi:uncharacterized protein (DUF2252 family)
MSTAKRRQLVSTDRGNGPSGSPGGGTGTTQAVRDEGGRTAPSHTVIAHLTPEERRARGKAARNEVPLESHAVFAPEIRLDPIELLEEQATTRVPELVPIRHGRMAVTPFTFYRGAALIMAADLAGTPTSGLHAQLCGDAHLSNFGMFGSPERHMIFDINDFDETSVGPWEWDVKRLASSLEIGGRDRGFTAKERRAAVLASVREYRTAMRSFAPMTNLEVWYAHIDMDQRLPEIKAQIPRKRAKVLDKAIAKMKTRDSMQAYTKLTEEVDGEPRILSQPPLIVPVRELLDEEMRKVFEEEIAGILRSYRKTLETDRRHLLEQYRLVEVARKVVGVGSVGTRAWVVLLLGRDGQDPLFLQAKEAERSVLERFAGKSRYSNSGQRVVAGQRLMQATSDIFLGWDRIAGIVDGVPRDFYFRQFRDWKGSIDIESMIPKGLVLYARLCGWTLARAHARSGDRIAIAAYMGKSDAFDRAIADFSDAYADQNERDYRSMLSAIGSGRLQAQTDL